MQSKELKVKIAMLLKVIYRGPMKKVKNYHGCKVKNARNLK